MRKEKVKLIIKTIEELKQEDNKDFNFYLKNTEIKIENRYKFIKSEQQQIRFKDLFLDNNLFSYLNEIINLNHSFDWELDLIYYQKEIMKGTKVRLARIDLIIW